ncbi:sensor histidine kinase [Nocardiopsis metallicus]|uniref:histidine kinase n=1 Tax=Nocardiopsis metallicus TaxID=179819 RepID=A0A840WHD9_9ACTN|nr:HAMP domain-containing sensor histidine kinase [Nocardiopsis metallicus]MBB5490866.1 signal transduction histidine kinase [Nocardiopsis metallicus]
MRRLLARAVTLATVLVAVVMIGVTGLWAWWEARERAEAEVRSQAHMVASVAEADPDPALLRRVVASTSAGARGHLSVHLPDGTTVGASRAEGDDVAAARDDGAGFEGAREIVDGTVYLLAVAAPEGGTADGGDVSVVEVYQPRWEATTGLGRALGGLVVVAVLVVLGAVLITDRLSRPARRALRALADTAVAIGEGRLNARIRVHGPRDLVVLGESINAIGERVQGLLTKEREMAADVSHRLRTPLTALRLDTETLPGAEGERIRDAIAALERDVDAIIRDVRPQEPAPGRGEAERSCDLSEAVLDRMGFWSMLAADQGREVTLDLPEAPCLVALNRDECVAVLDSLVGNVFRYTPADGPFAVAVVEHAGWVTLIVEDAGPEFADPAAALRRGTSGGGSTGLGLDIVRHAVEATGGTVHLERGKLGGARVRARFAQLDVPHEEEQPRAWRLRRSG